MAQLALLIFNISILISKNAVESGLRNRRFNYSNVYRNFHYPVQVGIGRGRGRGVARYTQKVPQTATPPPENIMQPKLDIGFFNSGGRRKSFADQMDFLQHPVQQNLQQGGQGNLLLPNKDMGNIFEGTKLITAKNIFCFH